MKHPEYDSPFKLTISDITTQMKQKIDETCWNTVQRVGIDIDKEKLLIALKQDSERYREAYAKGYDTGYEKRDEEIIRCKDCKHYMTIHCTCDGCCISDDWFCADGKRKDETEIIRCKDCKHFVAEDQSCKYHGTHLSLKPDNYCSHCEGR